MVLNVVTCREHQEEEEPCVCLFVCLFVRSFVWFALTNLTK